MFKKYKEYIYENPFYKYDNSKVEIEDAVTIINVNTKEKIKYTIVRSLYDYKVIVTDVGYDNFGVPFYAKIPINEYNIEEGIISSDCLVAKSLIGKRVGEIVKLPDGEFLINKIRKHKMYIN